MKLNHLFFALPALLMVGCTQVPVLQHKAVFEDFVYQGNDDYYNQHPLQADDEFYNPILPGWYSDPSICSDGKGNYFMVTSTFGYYPGVPLFHSTDMVNWRQVGHILTRPEQLPLERSSVSTGGIFAASIFYNKYNDTYYMITTNMGRMMRGQQGNFIVKSKDPLSGEWSDPIWLEDMNGIDPSLFFDEDGKAYVVHCGMGRNAKYPGCNQMIMHEYDVQNDKVIVESATVLAEGGAFPEDQPIALEGPHLYKWNGMYYLMCAEGGTELGHSEVIFRSNDLHGKFVAWEKNPILTQRTLGDRQDGVYCTGHADIVQDPQGGWWSVFLGTRRIDGEMENLGRETFMMPVRWSDDGWPYMTQGDDQVPLILKMPGAKRSEQVTFGNFSISDDFTLTKLADYWVTAHDAATAKYSLTELPGTLVLNCDTMTLCNIQGSAAYVGRRLQHHQFRATTRMYFQPEAGEWAGMVLLKNENLQYYLAVGAESIEVQKIGEKDAYDVLASAPLKGEKDFTLCIEGTNKGKTFDFSYSTDGGRTWNMLLAGADADYLATHYSANGSSSFTGTTVGMYAVKR